MAMDPLLNSFFDELEKIAVSSHISSFMQSRSGRRPIRAHNLIGKDSFRTPPDEKTLAEDGEREGMKDYEVEGGPGMVEAQEGNKVAAMAGDLRIKNPGMGHLTNPPTEGSKGFAFKQLTNSAKPGKFLNKTEPKHLIKPGPSIKQIAPLPR